MPAKALGPKQIQHVTKMSSPSRVGWGIWLPQNKSPPGLQNLLHKGLQNITIVDCSVVLISLAQVTVEGQ